MEEDTGWHLGGGYSVEVVHDIVVFGMVER